MSAWERLGGIQGKAAAVLVVVFLAGGGTGFFAGRWQVLMEKNESETAREVSRGGKRRHGRRHFMRRLESDLGLEANQLERVRATLRQHHEKMRTIRQQMRPQVQGILEEARREIRILLNTDQQSIFDRMVRDFEERRRKRHERWKRKMMDDSDR